MIHYFKKVLIFSIALLCLYSFPIQGLAQYPDTARLQEVKPLPKSDIKFKGWYFGVMVGTAKSNLDYSMRLGQGTDIKNATGEFYNANVSIGNHSFFQANARYVTNNWLTIDIANTIKADGGNVMLYKEDGRSFNLYGPRKKPYQEYSFNLTNYQFLATPTITVGPGNVQWTIGVPVGFLVVLNREGTLSKSFDIKSRAGLLGITTGISCKVFKGIFTTKLESITSSNYGKGNWNVWSKYYSITTGYALSISAFKKKTKIAIL